MNCKKRQFARRCAKCNGKIEEGEWDKGIKVSKCKCTEYWEIDPKVNLKRIKVIPL